jgi:hypothetical protein
MARDGKDSMKKTQRSLLFRQNVNRTEEEWRVLSNRKGR